MKKNSKKSSNNTVKDDFIIVIERRDKKSDLDPVNYTPDWNPVHMLNGVPSKRALAEELRCWKQGTTWADFRVRKYTPVQGDTGILATRVRA
jgi:hypothetical protein